MTFTVIKNCLHRQEPIFEILVIGIEHKGQIMIIGLHKIRDLEEGFNESDFVTVTNDAC